MMSRTYAQIFSNFDMSTFLRASCPKNLNLLAFHWLSVGFPLAFRPALLTASAWRRAAPLAAFWTNRRTSSSDHVRGWASPAWASKSWDVEHRCARETVSSLLALDNVLLAGVMGCCRTLLALPFVNESPGLCLLPQAEASRHPAPRKRSCSPEAPGIPASSTVSFTSCH